MFFLSRAKTRKQVRTIEMVLDHDGSNWLVSNDRLRLSASSLEELDRMVEAAMEPELAREKSIHVFMTFNNEVIPMWIRPYMNHYFNRILELPLQYQ